jgi:hypothetical protein
LNAAPGPVWKLTAMCIPRLRVLRDADYLIAPSDAILTEIVESTPVPL